MRQRYDCHTDVVRGAWYGADTAVVPYCRGVGGAVLPWCTWCRTAVVYVVPYCRGVRGAVVPWCTWCRGAVVPWCRTAVLPWCRGSVVPWCRGAVVPWCRGAVVRTAIANWPNSCINARIRPIGENRSGCPRINDRTRQGMIVHPNGMHSSAGILAQFYLLWCQ